MSVVKHYLFEENVSKICKSCDGLQSINAFAPNSHECKKCRKSYMDNWVNRNRVLVNENQRIYQTTIKGRSSVLLNAALTRAKKKDQPFKLKLEDVIKGISVGFCSKTFFTFDMKMERVKNKYQINPLSPSIDKIDPFGIYEPDNVQYVCSWYNLAKGQMSESDLITFCKRIAEINQ